MHICVYIYICVCVCVYSKWTKVFYSPPRFPIRTNVKPLFVECL